MALPIPSPLAFTPVYGSSRRRDPETGGHRQRRAVDGGQVRDVGPINGDLVPRRLRLIAIAAKAAYGGSVTWYTARTTDRSTATSSWEPWSPMTMKVQEPWCQSTTCVI
jgi:hypothetical protein